MAPSTSPAPAPSPGGAIALGRAAHVYQIMEYSAGYDDFLSSPFGYVLAYDQTKTTQCTLNTKSVSQNGYFMSHGLLDTLGSKETTYFSMKSLGNDMYTIVPVNMEGEIGEDGVNGIRIKIKAHPNLDDGFKIKGGPNDQQCSLTRPDALRHSACMICEGSDNNNFRIKDVTTSYQSLKEWYETGRMIGWAIVACVVSLILIAASLFFRARREVIVRRAADEPML